MEFVADRALLQIPPIKPRSLALLPFQLLPLGLLPDFTFSPRSFDRCPLDQSRSLLIFDSPSLNRNHRVVPFASFDHSSSAVGSRVLFVCLWSMRLNGEVSYLRHEEEEAEERVPLTFLSPPPSQKLVVGYALTSKKVKSFLQPKLEGLAR